jgi:hypothetical protein
LSFSVPCTPWFQLPLALIYFSLFFSRCFGVFHLNFGQGLRDGSDGRVRGAVFLFSSDLLYLDRNVRLSPQLRNLPNKVRFTSSRTYSIEG